MAYLFPYAGQPKNERMKHPYHKLLEKQQRAAARKNLPTPIAPQPVVEEPKTEEPVVEEEKPRRRHRHMRRHWRYW